jgi:hypothetical protein
VKPTGTVLRKTRWQRVTAAFWDWLRADPKRPPSGMDRSWVLIFLPFVLIASILLYMSHVFGLW